MTKEEAIELDIKLQSAKQTFADYDEPMTIAKKELDWQIKQAESLWGETNAELIKNHGEAIKAVAAIEASLRSSIVELYNAQDDKTAKSGIIPGWGVQVGTKLEYEPEKAIAWAVEHKHLGLLKLDTTAFKKIAEVTKPDFVTFKEEPTARIDTKKGK